MALRCAALQLRGCRRLHTSAVLNSGGGGPVALGRPPVRPLAEEDELVWDDGSAQPEWCTDQFTLVSKYEALGYTAAGLLSFAAFGVLISWRDKKSKVPWVPREYPFDNLKAELGLDNGSNGSDGGNAVEDES